MSVEREEERWRGGWNVPEVLAASRRGVFSPPLFSPLHPLMLLFLRRTSNSYLRLLFPLLYQNTHVISGQY